MHKTKKMIAVFTVVFLFLSSSISFATLPAPDGADTASQPVVESGVAANAYDAGSPVIPPSVETTTYNNDTPVVQPEVAGNTYAPTANVDPALTGTAAMVVAEQPVVGAYASDELLVKFKPGVDENAVYNKHKTKVLKRNKALKVSRVKIDKNAKLKDVMDELKADSAVEYVEYNYYAGVLYTPNDPQYASQWGISKIKADQAWDTTKGSTAVTIAVLDTGVDSNHPDLAANLVPGYNTITDTTNTEDDYGHGTHVAGIAAGAIDNGLGIAGVAGNCKIMPVKVLGANGLGLYSDFGEGIYWAANNGAKVINMSLGGTVFSQYLQDAVDDAYSKGAIVIAAAGNAGNTVPNYPAALNHVVAVSATDSNNIKAAFSSYGSHIDVAAPGVNIYSTTFDGSYGTMQGTSMATPFVSGAAALIISHRPALTPGQVEAVLTSSAVDIGATGKDTYFGYGLVDVSKALTQAIDTSSVGLTLVGDSPDPFGPTGTSTTKITYTLSKSSKVTIKIYDALNNVVKNLITGAAKNAGTQYITWNGKNDSGALVGSGIYTYTVQAEDYSGNISSLLSDTITVDRINPVISGVNDTPDPFAPTGANTAAINYTLSESAKATVTIYNSANAVVKVLESKALKNAGANSVTWDGKNTAGAIVGDGTYTYKITAVDLVGWSAVLASGTITVEKDNPSITAVSDTPDPFKATGTTVNTIKYTLSENATVTLKIFDGSNTLVRTLVNGILTTAGAKSAAWNGKNDAGALVEDGTYTYKINATDGAGKVAVEVIGTIVTDKTAPVISGVSDTPDPFAPTGANTAAINYTLSESVKATVTIYNSANAVVKVLQTNALKNAGANSVTWDGKNTAGVIVGDGTYTYKITAVDLVGWSAVPASGTITVEKDNPSITAVSDSPDPFRPTGTNVNTIKYTLSENANVTLKIFDGSNTFVRTLVNGILTTAGAKTAAWNGKNDSNVLVGSGTYTYKIDATDMANKTATQVTGTITVDVTPPTISAVSVDTNPFHPTGANLTTIAYTLSENAKVTISIFNSSNVLVKTLCTSLSKIAGVNSVTWNGTNSKNILVPVGTYTYKIDAADTLGNKATQASGTITVN